MSAPDQQTHEGSCFCGAVRIVASGTPFAMGYCHCKSCRDWSAAPVTAYTLWQPSDVRVTAGEDKLATFGKRGGAERQFCTECGGGVLARDPGGNFTDVFAPVLPTLKFEPAAHVNYGVATVRIHDGLPKLKDFPAEMGGSGELLPE